MLHWQMLSTLAALALFASDVALAIPQRFGEGGGGEVYPGAWHVRADDTPGFWNYFSEKNIWSFLTWSKTYSLGNILNVDHSIPLHLKAHINIHLNSGLFTIKTVLFSLYY